MKCADSKGINEVNEEIVMAIRRVQDSNKHTKNAKADALKKYSEKAKAKGSHAAESGYAKGQCKSGVLYKPDSPCGRKLMKEALGQKEPLHGEQIDMRLLGPILIHRRAINPKLLEDAAKKFSKTKKIK